MVDQCTRRVYGCTTQRCSKVRPIFVAFNFAPQICNWFVVCGLTCSLQLFDQIWKHQFAFYSVSVLLHVEEFCLVQTC